MEVSKSDYWEQNDSNCDRKVYKMTHDQITTGTNEQALSDLYVQNKALSRLLRDSRTRAAVFILVFALAASLLFSGLGSPRIYMLDEARNAQCAREMMQNHDLIVPTFNGRIRTDKPPLHYYFMILAYKLFGVSSFSARFFSAVFGLLTLVLISIFTSKYLGSRIALLATVILASSTHFLFEFRLAVPDPYFIFFVLCTMFAGFIYLKNDKAGWLYGAAVFAALATLTKGPVAVLLPLLALLVLAGRLKKWKSVLSWHILGAAALFLLLALPWYLMVDHATNGEWTTGFFMDHNLSRYTAPAEGHGGFFLLPLIMCLVGLLPFSSFIAEPIRHRNIIFNNNLVLFSLIAFLVIVVFFSLSATKLPNYAIPAYPFAAIMIASYFDKALNGRTVLPRYPLILTAAIFCILPIAVYFLLKYEEQTKELTRFTWVLAIPAALFVLFTSNIKRLTIPFRIYGMAVISLVFNLLIFLILYPKAFHNNPVSKTLPIVKKASEVVAYRHANAGYNFYLDKPIQRLETHEIDSLCKTVPGTVVITSAELLKELDKLPLRTIAIEHDNFERRETVLLSR